MKKFVLIFFITFSFLSVSAQTGKDNLTESSDLQEAQKIGLEVVKLFNEMQRSSEIAAYQSKFHPTMLEGKPVKVTGVIIYNFTF